MKKIVNNKKYDTDTATAICRKGIYSIRPDKYERYLRAFESIYQKANGEYFLFHESLQESAFDMEDKIRPLTEEEALSYCQKWMTADDYEKRFGVVEE